MMSDRRRRPHRAEPRPPRRHDALDVSSHSHDFEASASSVGTFDLSKNYQNAVECLVQCESVINGLQERLAERDDEIAMLRAEVVGRKNEYELNLAGKDREIEMLEGRLLSRGKEQVKSLEALGAQLSSRDKRIASLEKKLEEDNMVKDMLAAKDEHIAHLEEKIVQISFELANAQAFEDEHRAKRRNSVNLCDDDQEGVEGETGSDSNLDVSWASRGDDGNHDGRNDHSIVRRSGSRRWSLHGGAPEPSEPTTKEGAARPARNQLTRSFSDWVTGLSRERGQAKDGSGSTEKRRSGSGNGLDKFLSGSAAFTASTFTASTLGSDLDASLNSRCGPSPNTTGKKCSVDVSQLLFLKCTIEEEDGAAVGPEKSGSGSVRRTKKSPGRSPPIDVIGDNIVWAEASERSGNSQLRRDDPRVGKEEERGVLGSSTFSSSSCPTASSSNDNNEPGASSDGRGGGGGGNRRASLDLGQFAFLRMSLGRSATDSAAREASGKEDVAHGDERREGTRRGSHSFVDVNFR